MFTTHGDYSARVMADQAAVPSLAPRYGFSRATADRIVAQYHDTGFAFSVYEGDPPGSPYGHSVSSRAWVEARISEAGLRLEHAIEGGWGRHQDVYACSPAVSA